MRFDEIMRFGEVVKTRSITIFKNSNYEDFQFTLSAPGKTKGKHTMNMLFVYLGNEPIKDPIPEEEIFDRMGDLGWKRMTDDEFKEHVEKRKKKET